MSRVLIVEDSPTMAQLLVFIIKKLKGVEIDTANDGANGLKKLSEGRYDLVLTDINMPLIDGLKFVSLIRNDRSSGNKDVPVIIITTEGEDAIMAEGMKLGANSYITKPVNSQRVIETVKKFINA